MFLLIYIIDTHSVRNVFRVRIMSHKHNLYNIIEYIRNGLKAMV